MCYMYRAYRVTSLCNESSQNVSYTRLTSYTCRHTWRTWPQEVEKLAASRMFHGLLDELDDGGGAVRLGLRVEAEHSC